MANASDIPVQTDDAAAKAAARARLQLVRDERGLALSDGTMRVQGDFTRLLNRLKPANLNRELLVRAAKVKGVPHPRAIDATAGLGDDALLLAASGFEVKLFERNAIIALLLEDALERARENPVLADIVSRMTLVGADSLPALRRIAEETRSAASGPAYVPDVIVLDPMFPERQKNAKVKKKLQLMQQLEAPCHDEAALLEAAIAACPRKVIVKRPAKGPHLAARKPDYSLSGKAVRYDCYAHRP